MPDQKAHKANNSDDTVESSSDPSKNSVSHASVIIMTIGDTTWRMFIPTIGLTILGLVADKQLGTTPWLMVIGILGGGSLAAYLVVRQVRSVK